MTETKEEFVYSRTFAAPRSLVWEAFTKAEHLAHWWGPKGFDIDVRRFELRPGGLFVYRMHSAQGNEMWGRFAFQEIRPEDRLVWINSFSDENGGLKRAPFGDTIPLEMLTIVELLEEGDGTNVTLRSRPINATAEEEATYFGMRASMEAGTGGTFDKLTAYLKAISAS